MSYTRTISLALDAQQYLDRQLATTLHVATAVVQRFPHPVDDLLLADLASTLNVDFITLYDRDLGIIASSHPLSSLGQREMGSLIRRLLLEEEDTTVAEVQLDSDSKTALMHTLARRDDGTSVHVGIMADSTYRHYGAFTSQHVIDELSQHNQHTRLALLDADYRIIAATDATKTNAHIEGIEHIIPVDPYAYTIVRYDHTSYLAYNLPLQNNGGSPSSLIVLFDLTEVNRLLYWVAVTISLVLLLFYLLFLHAFTTSWRLNRQIMHAATHDELTGLANLRLFNQISKKNGAGGVRSVGDKSTELQTIEHASRLRIRGQGAGQSGKLSERACPQESRMEGISPLR